MPLITSISYYNPFVLHICNYSLPVAQKLRTVGLRGFHSEQELIENSNMDVRILPALQDNYMYLVSVPIYLFTATTL